MNIEWKPIKDFEDFYLAEAEGKANDYDKLISKQKEFIE